MTGRHIPDGVSGDGVSGDGVSGDGVSGDGVSGKRSSLDRRRLPRPNLRALIATAAIDWDALEAYAHWLQTEAVAAGGIGPAEREHVWERHVLDSLVCAAAFDGRTSGRLLDVGSGVGLPGIPLAIAFPAIEVTLLDRSGRRTDLAQRAIRILGLSNVTVRHADLSDVAERFTIVTMRAALPPGAAVDGIRRVLEPDGIGVVALSRVAPPSGTWPTGVEMMEVSADVLDSPVWLLTIRP